MTARVATAGLLSLLAVIAGRAAAPSGAASSAGEAGAAPPARLSETGLYAAGRPGTIDSRNRPFSPQYPLWSDGAIKSRWVYLPEGGALEDAGDGTWRVPDGTKFWKEFVFHGKKVETRLLWKVSGDRWIAASYVWNGEQTDAELAPEDGLPGAAEIAPGRRHSIPSRADCLTCHGSRPRPLGFNALQLSPDRDPNAVHAEPLADGMLTLRTLVEEGLLAPARTDLSNPPRIRTASALTRSALGYLAANCGTCHNRSGETAAAVPPVGYADVLEDADAVARSLLGRRTRWQAPGAAGETMLVDPGAPERSALLARMRSRSPSSQMPPLGTVLRDDEAIALVERWIETTAGSPAPAQQ